MPPRFRLRLRHSVQPHMASAQAHSGLCAATLMPRPLGRRSVEPPLQRLRPGGNIIGALAARNGLAGSPSAGPRRRPVFPVARRRPDPAEALVRRAAPAPATRVAQALAQAPQARHPWFRRPPHLPEARPPARPAGTQVAVAAPPGLRASLTAEVQEATVRLDSLARTLASAAPRPQGRPRSTDRPPHLEVYDGGCDAPLRAHNPKVAGSNPAPATQESPGNPGKGRAPEIRGSCLFWSVSNGCQTDRGGLQRMRPVAVDRTHAYPSRRRIAAAQPDIVRPSIGGAASSTSASCCTRGRRGIEERQLRSQNARRTSPRTPSAESHRQINHGHDAPGWSDRVPPAFR